MSVYEPNTTTVTATPAQEDSEIGCHPEYFKTVPGMLKVAELVSLAIGFFCVVSADFMHVISTALSILLYRFSFYFCALSL